MNKAWNRLNGRWVITAYSPWDKARLYYRQKKLPTCNILEANSYPTKESVQNALRFLKLNVSGTLRWFPMLIKDTDLFKEILKNAA